uniref:Fructose-bisphosphate aldolase n=2 Tax=Viridiplantae TaxID=33090 RepID=A0A7R9Y7Y7_9VIRI|mmetsp:Transcript_9338/g.38275  ORF Transcript_9338/g.38275 Transcript_9338/m.38275 type:complete len:386 (+) Transcript_9338:44-1201(+)
MASSMIASTFTGKAVAAAARPARAAKSARATTVCGAFDAELVETAAKITRTGCGIMAMDESNGTCGQRLDSIGVENTEENRQRYRELLITTQGLGEYISGAILFEETLYQSCADGTSFVDALNANNIVPGIKVDTGLKPLIGGNEGESWCSGLDTLADRAAAYYKQGARFAKWRTAINISAGPSELAIAEAAHGLARYGKICQENGLVPIIEPEVLLDGEHDIDTTLAVAERVWSATFKAMQDSGVMMEGILLKPSMVTPAADCPDRADADTIAKYTLGMLGRRVPPSVPGIMFLSGGQSEMEATMNLNAMNQSPNPWHVSFSYARALQNSVLKTWLGKDENKVAAQAKLIARAKANSMAQQGKYDPEGEDESATEGMYVKNYTY